MSRAETDPFRYGQNEGGSWQANVRYPATPLMLNTSARRHGMEGLMRLQAGLDAHEEPDDWPEDVCRDAFCGHWERNNGQYFWHRPSDHR